MTVPDLTPKTYVSRSRAQRAMKAWTLPVLLCGLLAVVAVALNAGRAQDQSLRIASEQLAQAQSRIDQARKATASLKTQLNKHERELQAERQLTQRPDWSALLSLVAGQFDSELVMTGFRLGEASDSGVKRDLGVVGSDAADESVWLIVTGVAASNTNVPGLILKLESLGLFKRVVMTSNQREAFAGGQRTGFTIACRVQ